MQVVSSIVDGESITLNADTKPFAIETRSNEISINQK